MSGNLQFELYNFYFSLKALLAVHSHNFASLSVRKIKDQIEQVT